MRAWFAFLLLLPALGAGDGDAWMQKLDQEGWSVPEHSTVHMEITRPNGRVLERRFQLWSWSDGKRAARLLRFDGPAELRGTALLTWYRKGGEERYYHAPDSGTRRIGATDRKEPFVQSDLTIEDLTVAYDPEARVYTLLREEELDGRPCVVVEDRPRTEAAARASGYQKVLLWVDRERLVVPRIEFYDRSGALLKTLVVPEIEEVEGHWRGKKVVVSNLQAGSRTVLTVEVRDLPARVGAAHFSVEALDEG